MMKIRLSPREQRTLLLVVGLGAVIFWVYSSVIVGPLGRERRAVREQVRSARLELKTLEAATANEAALREQQQKLQETVASLRELLPAEEELPAVIELLSDLASQSQVKIQTIFPQRPLQDAVGGKSKTAPEPLVYKDILVQIDALAGFHQLGTFLSLVESGEKPMQVSSLKISVDPRDSRRHHIKLLVQSYFAASGTAIGEKEPQPASPTPGRS
jgi:Tfp pilus assembly protein PilO